MTTSHGPHSQYLRDAREAALLAWTRIVPFYRGQFRIFEKQGTGPATEADHAADAAILEFLRERHPGDGFLTEESVDDMARRERARVWIIDPIDGTNDFIEGGEDFAVHVALAERQPDGVARPVVSVVYEPATGLLFTAARGGRAHVEEEIRGAEGERWWQGPNPTAERATFSRPRLVSVSSRAAVNELTAIVSKSHMTKRLKTVMETLPVREFNHRGGLGVKVMEVAAGRADFYLHTERHRSNEWDICAPHLILEEAGGRVTDLDGRPIVYNNENVKLPAGVVASNGACHDNLLAELRKIEGLYP